MHRVWVLDGADQPQGVITLTDLLQLFLRTAGEERTIAALAPSPSQLQLRQRAAAQLEAHRQEAAVAALKRHAAPKRLSKLEARLAALRLSAGPTEAAETDGSKAVTSALGPAAEKDAARIDEASRRVSQRSEVEATNAASRKPRAPQVLTPQQPATPTDSTHLAAPGSAPISPMAALTHAAPPVPRPAFLDEL